MTKKTNFLILAGLFVLLCPFAAGGADFTDPSGVPFAVPGGYESHGNGIAVDTFSVLGPYIYVTGNVGAGGSSNWLTLKYNAQGIFIASTSYDFSFTEQDEAKAIAVDREGNVIVAGFASNGAIQKSVIVKYTPDLILISSTTFDPGMSNFARAVAIDRQDNIIVAGDILMGTNDLLVLKYNRELVLKSSTTMDIGTVSDVANGVAVNSTGEIIVTGESNARMVTVKWNPDLTSSSAPRLEGPGANDSGLAVTVDIDDNIIAVGKVWNATEDFITAKYDANLALISSRTYDHNAGNDKARGVAVDGAGNIYVTGPGAASMGGSNDYVTMQYDANLSNSPASKLLTGSASTDSASAIALGVPPYLYITGTRSNNIHTVRYSAADFLPPSEDTTSPAAVTNLSAANDKGIGSNMFVPVVLTWTTPGDDGNVNSFRTNSECIIRYSTSSSTNLEHEIRISTDVAPNRPVSYRFEYQNMLEVDKVYYFKVWYKDGAENRSDDSNLVQLRTQVVAGDPNRVMFDSYGLTVQSGQPSQAPVKLKLVDYNMLTAKAITPVTVALSAKNQYDYSDDTTASFSLTADFTTPITSVTIPTGAAGAEFYFKTSASPYSMIRISYTISYLDFSDMQVNVVSGGISNSRVHKGDYADSKTVSIGAEETAYIDFVLDDPSVGWEVLIATSADMAYPVWTSHMRWDDPSRGQISWNGYLEYVDPVLGFQRYEKAPRGTYYVRIQLGNGGIRDDTLRIAVESMEISGRVTNVSGNGLSEAYISAYGPSYSYTQTDSSGYYKLGGLREGTYSLNFSKDGYSPYGISGVNAGGTLNVILQQPTYVKVNARRGVSDSLYDPEQIGSIQLIPADNTNSVPYYGSLHFAIDVSTSDNGMYAYNRYAYNGSTTTPQYEIDNSTGGMYTGGKWTFVMVNPGIYTLNARLDGYDLVEMGNIVISTGEVRTISDVYFALKKNVSGTVQLAEPSAESWGTWASIEAIPEGNSWGTAWGWTSISQGSSTGTYVIPGLSAGNYLLRAFAPGYRKGAVAVTVGTDDTFVTAPLITLATGGGLSGTVTVEGDTSDASLNLYGSPAHQPVVSPALGYSSSFSVYLNAWSPDSYSYGWTQVSLNKNAAITSSTFTIKGLDDGTYWINSWLSGFELDGAIGWNGVKATVSGGSGTVNLTFKRHSGRIRVRLVIPEGGSYSDAKVYLQGGTFWNNDWQQGIVVTSASYYGASFDPAAGILTTPPLGTGFYQIKGEYVPTGLSKSKSIMAVNGQTKDTEINLAAQTYSVSGTVSVSQSNPPQGYTDIAVIVATAPLVTNAYGVLLNWETMSSTTAFRVKAIDYMKKDIEGTATSLAGSGSDKAGVINSNGSYAIKGLVPGVYLLKIPSLDLDGNENNGAETAAVETRVIVVDGNVTDTDLEVSKGYSVSGQLKLPAGEIATRDFTISIFKADKFKVDNFRQQTGWSSRTRESKVTFDDTNAADYELKGLASGDYVIAVQDWGYYDSMQGISIPRQYANSSIAVKIESSNLNGKNIQLNKGGTITLKLRDADSRTIITPRNRDRMLPQSYMISSIANPWVEGGWGSVETYTAPATATETEAAGQNNQDIFTMSFLPEASYDVLLGQSSYGFYMPMSGAGTGNNAGNQTNYAAKTISGVKVNNGVTVDLGIIDIKQGLTVTGTVKDKDGNGIPNIPVVAVPSLTNEWSSELRGFTDINGKYSIVGLNPEYPYYDIIACPRIDPREFGGYFFFGSGGLSYGESVRSMVKIKDAAAVDFVLSEAKGSVTGEVSTEDGGVLQNPEDLNLPTAKVFMQLDNTFPRTNPIGDIVTDTETDGTFSIEALPAGIYRLVVLSGGYASVSKSVTVSNSGVALGTISLKRGAKIAGKVTKPDGKNPSTSEVRGITAATADFSEILVGALKTSGEKTVTGYEFNGFQAGNSYDLMFMSEDDELVQAVSNFSVPFSSYVKTDYDLTFKVSAPSIFSRAKKEGSKYTIYFDLTGALRSSVPDDNDVTKLITLASGSGTLSDQYMAPNRKTLSCVYTAPSAEARFTLRLHGYARTVNPETGAEFEIDESFQYYAGIGARNKVKVSNLRGGKVTLEGDASSILFSPGSFEVGGSTSSVYVDFSRADSLSDLLVSAPGRRAPRLVIPRAAPSYPGTLHKAMQLAQAAGVDPFSSFYDVMLPQGVSRTLKKDATLSLQYTGSNVDPSTLNIYYYDETNNVYLLQNKNKTVNSADQTISVSISHASVFVILQANVTTIQGTTYDGPLFVYNYPNPFNLNAKSVTLANAPAASQNQTITGTMIHYGLPQNVSGDMEIKIYDVAGELVRTLQESAKTGGSHYYIEWDGTNDSGKKVASGVYIAHFTVDKRNDKFFKMAIIK